MDGFTFLDRILRFTWKFRQRSKVNYLIANTNEVVWIESGTYLGNTTMFLAQNSKFVFSIEPMESFYHRSKKRLKAYSNISLMNTTSEDGLVSCLVEADHLVAAESPGIIYRLNFFLDGHYSGPGTFMSGVSTPILFELDAIESFFKVSRNIHLGIIFIDDARLFFNAHPGYPQFQELTSRYNNFTFEHVKQFDVLRASRK
jgi:hypothetical protein